MRGRVDGLIVMAPHMNLDELFAHLPPSIPAVLLNCQDNGQGRPELRVDNVAGARAMVRHLLDCGRRAIVGAPAARGLSLAG